MKISKKLPTNLKKINPFIKHVIGKLSSFSLSRDEVFDIELALEEALTNAMRHGNKLNQKLSVTVTITATQKKVVLDVHDKGEGFAFFKVPDPTKKRYRNKPSGRGIFIIRTIMDEVTFYDSGRGLTLTKLLKGSHEK